MNPTIGSARGPAEAGRLVGPAEGSGWWGLWASHQPGQPDPSNTYTSGVVAARDGGRDKISNRATASVHLSHREPCRLGLRQGLRPTGLAGSEECTVSSLAPAHHSLQGLKCVRFDTSLANPLPYLFATVACSILGLLYRCLFLRQRQPHKKKWQYGPSSKELTATLHSQTERYYC